MVSSSFSKYCMELSVLLEIGWLFPSNSFSVALSPYSPSETPVVRIIVCLTQRSLKTILISFNSFFFLLFCFSDFHYSVFSWLIHSSVSFNQLTIHPSSVCFHLFIVLFPSVWFFIFSNSLWIMFNFSLCIHFFFFWEKNGSSSWSLFWTPSQVDCLRSLYLVLLGFYLVLMWNMFLCHFIFPKLLFVSLCIW